MKKGFTLFAILVLGVVCLPVLSHHSPSSFALAEASANEKPAGSSHGLARAVDQFKIGSEAIQVEMIEYQNARVDLEETLQKLLSVIAGTPTTGDTGATTNTTGATTNTAATAMPSNMATVFEWDCPDSAKEHSMHVFTIMTDAKFIDPVVEDGFDLIPLHGPVVVSTDGALRELSYSWTAAPNNTGYGVEVVTYDPEKGIQRHRQKVNIIGTDSPGPGPGPGPQPPETGFGLAAKVPTWVATIPQEGRADLPRIKQSFLATAQAAENGSFQTLQEMEAASVASLVQAIQNKSAFARSQFSQMLNSAITELKASGKISTPQQYAAALREIGGAL